MSGTLLVLREGPHWQAGQLDGGSHRSWWLEVLVRHQLCHNRKGSQLPTLCSCNIATLPPAGLPMVALLHLSTAFRKGIRVQHYVWVMEVGQCYQMVQDHLKSSNSSKENPSCAPGSSATSSVTGRRGCGNPDISTAWSRRVLEPDCSNGWVDYTWGPE